MPQGIEAPASMTAEGQTSHTQNQDQPSIYQLMALVMNDVRDVGKNGFNDHQKYKFRGVDDFIGALAQPLRKHGVFMMTEILDFQTSVRGKMNATHMRVAFHFYGPAGDCVTATTLGEASDTADKASNKAMSAALKYALMQTFMIPVDAGSLDDGDRDHPVGQSSPADSYMQRLRKPAVWNNVTALQAMHSEAKADGLLQETVYAPGGEEMPLGELIVARGRTLKAEAAERAERQAAEAPAVAAQVAAEAGTAPAAEDEPTPPSSTQEGPREAFTRLTEQYRNCWGNELALLQIRVEGKQLGLSEERVQGPPPESAWTTFDALLEARIAELNAEKSRAA
ncbi:ERF family protein [Streptomyces sp. NPDC008092]|uniref:ERF family protein n=1 Tax=Streptomyces sp. NPDC008092 TaxID=3364808 RepID=UPI0036EF2180